MSLKFTPAVERAAELVATTTLPFTQVAKQSHVPMARLIQLRTDPDFAAKVAEYRVSDAEAEVVDDVLRLPLASKFERVMLLAETVEDLRDVFRARKALAFPMEVDQAEYERMGGRSGLVTVRERMVGSGPYGVVVKDFTVDNASLKSLQSLLRQIAEELGQSGELQVSPTNGAIRIVIAERPDGPQ